LQLYACLWALDNGLIGWSVTLNECDWKIWDKNWGRDIWVNKVKKDEDTCI
jgi:hypothetical protein